MRPGPRHSAALVAVAVTSVLAGLAAPPPAAATFPGENGLIVFTGGNGLYLSNPETGRLRRLTESPYPRGEDYAPTFAPDGETIAFVREFHPRGSSARRRANIWLIGSDGGDARRITTGFAYEPAFSPDGETIAFRTGRDRIATIGIDGTGRRVIGPGFSPSYSPDGQRITYTRYDPEGGPKAGARVFTMAVDGSDVEAVTPPNTEAYGPHYSPDGSRIAMGYDEDVDDYIISAASIRVDGTDIREIEPNPSREEWVYSPMYSPDGTSFSFVSVNEQFLEESCRCFVVSTIRTDGSRYDDLAGNGYDPDWGPAPQP